MRCFTSSETLMETEILLNFRQVLVVCDNTFTYACKSLSRELNDAVCKICFGDPFPDHAQYFLPVSSGRTSAVFLRKKTVQFCAPTFTGTYFLFSSQTSEVFTNVVLSQWHMIEESHLLTIVCNCNDLTQLDVDHLKRNRNKPIATISTSATLQPLTSADTSSTTLDQPNVSQYHPIAAVMGMSSNPIA